MAGESATVDLAVANDTLAILAIDPVGTFRETPLLRDVTVVDIPNTMRDCVFLKK